MKKLVIGIIGLILLFMLVVYVYIPSKVYISNQVVIEATQRPTQQFLLDEKGWTDWWPDTVTTGSTLKKGFMHNGYGYSIAEKYLSGIIVSTQKGDETFRSLVSLIPIGRDSIKISWTQTLETGMNPFQRIAQYRKAGKLKENMNAILGSFRSFIDKEENVYHISIQHAIVSDTLLVTTKTILQREPEQADIYRLVDKLQQFVAKEGAAVTNPPMSHSRRAEIDPSKNIELMVALPVNKVLLNEGDVAFKRMVPGSVLVTEVKGGPAAIKRAFTQLDNYVQDHHYDSPAIPFESMITNRFQQPDTTQWVTKIYYPIM
jgi:hypothetical protein